MLPAMPRVLLVDDDSALLKLLEVNFRLEGFEALTAASGREALAIAAEQHPDAIVLDLMLPGMDGYEVCDRLRADPATASVPIVFLSGRTKPDDHRLDAGPFLRKPFDPAELIGVVRAQIGGVA